MRRTIVVISVLFLATAASYGSIPPELKQSLISKAESLSKPEFQQYASDKLKSLTGRIDALKARVKTADKGHESNFEGLVQEVDAEREKTSRLLEQFQKTRARSSMDLKGRLASALANLGVSVDKAERNFQQ